MNKGTAIVGFLLSFIAGMFLMWGVDRRSGVEIAAEGSTATGEFDHSAASVPVTTKDPIWARPQRRSPSSSSATSSVRSAVASARP